MGLIDKDLHEKVKEKRAILYSEMDEKVDITKRMYDILDSAIKTVGEVTYVVQESASGKARQSVMAMATAMDSQAPLSSWEYLGWNVPSIS